LQFLNFQKLIFNQQSTAPKKDVFRGLAPPC